MNISFAKLGHEACESCTKNELHLSERSEDCEPECEHCVTFQEHKRRYTTARQEYFLDKSRTDEDSGTLALCADMQKVTMLPEIPGAKSAVFTGRICCYNETFSPVRNNKEMKSISTVWHAGQMGRNDEDVASAFVSLLFSPHVRDKENFIIWLDNCSSQNKSWTLFHTMIKVFCSTQNVLLTLILKYFEAGHGFNACDSHHHLLENEFKKKKFL